ncbi:MAG TPA: hypothetical protein VFN50_10445 [Acidimicrobiales bacterium]|nr:hypothetical protein [Acidimicrobiales bacterium]
MPIRRAGPADAEPAALVRRGPGTGPGGPPGSRRHVETLSGLAGVSGIRAPGVHVRQEHRRGGLRAATPATARRAERHVPGGGEQAVGADESPGSRFPGGGATHRGQPGPPLA